MPSARLTDAAVRAAKPAGRAYRLSDGGGLSLQVQPSGARLWRYRYRLGGSENQFAIGEYPAISLGQARLARDEARELVRRGLHPARQRRADRLVTLEVAQNTFEAVAREWMAQNAPYWSPSYARQVRTVFAQDVFPQVGALPLREVSAAHLLAILRRVHGRGATAVAVLIRQWTSAVFRFGVATLRADHDPAAALRGALRRPPTRHKTALSMEALRALMDKVRRSPYTEPVRLALQLLAYTFVRPGELRLARWEEIDWTGRTWRIPAARMKMREAHVVPLSSQAWDLLQRLHALTGDGEFLFPNLRDPQRVMTATTLNRALERLGYAGVFSAHAFRTTASTQLNELGIAGDLIERQLAHRDRNRVRGAYNHATHLPARRQMLQAWANLVDGESGTASGHGDVVVDLYSALAARRGT